MSDDNAGFPPNDAPPAGSEHLNIKVTDNHNEVFFKIKKTTKLEKLMTAFCDRQELTRIIANVASQLDMTDGDTLEVHQEQVGGASV